MGYSHGVKWDEDKIKSGIQEVMVTLGISHFPTMEDMDLVTGDFGLSNKIAKTGGVKEWSQRLDIPLRSGHTQTGWVGEEYAKNALETRGFSVEKMPTRHPFDLLIDDVARIDVKFSNGYLSKEGYYMYPFRLEKKMPSCDFYFLIANAEMDKTIYIVPSLLTHQVQICLGKKSMKYEKYIDRYDLIRSYCSAMKNWESSI